MVLHEFPERIVTFVLLERRGFSQRKSVAYAFLAAAISTPLGTLVMIYMTVVGWWHTLSVEEAANRLDTDLEQGLFSDQAAQRLMQFGPNALTELPRPSFLARLWGQLKEFLVLLLIVSAIISAIIGWNVYRANGEVTEFIDAIAIMTIVILNAVLGLVQEGRAERALAALKRMAAPNATVIRDRRQEVIPAANLVSGDLVVLETGNYVPADVRLIASVNLRIEEASLTGESVPVEKRVKQAVAKDTGLGDRRNCGYMSTTVTYGRGRGLVIATGMDTEIGKIARMIQETKEDPTPLQVKLEQLGRWFLMRIPLDRRSAEAYSDLEQVAR